MTIIGTKGLFFIEIWSNKASSLFLFSPKLWGGKKKEMINAKKKKKEEERI